METSENDTFFEVELWPGLYLVRFPQVEQLEPGRIKSELAVSNSTAHYVISSEGHATPNSDRPINFLGGLPTKISPNQNGFTLDLVVRGT